MAMKDEQDREIPRDKPANSANASHESGAVPEGTELRQELSNTSDLSRQLKSTLSGLPHLTQASFIWPETEDQYAIKEELEGELMAKVENLTDYMPVLENRVQQRQRDRAQIQADSEKLNHEEPADCYAEAQEAQQKRCLEAVYDKDAASIVLAEAQAVLEVSRTRNFPGRKPVRQFPFPGAKPGDLPPHSQSSGCQAHPDHLGDEMEDLISLGPLGETRDRED
jgi:hypothetical protein